MENKILIADRQMEVRVSNGTMRHVGSHGPFGSLVALPRHPKGDQPITYELRANA